ncbi:MAG: hypothetical protein HRU46_11315 [Verrucomicrobiales bacterium]|nr:hypothetical protein [Verrucomicrobiales bacterium]
MREELRFQVAGDQVVAERVRDSQRFSLRPWQVEMLRRFDGKRTFEQASREVYGIFPGGFTAMGLLNFYRWLYQENLVVCECQSIFELVDDEPEAKPAVRQMIPKLKERIASAPGIQLSEGQQHALKISAAVLFCLCVFRIAYVAAPIFEPPVDRAFAAIEGYFMEDVTAVKEARTDQEFRETSVQELELAVKAGPEQLEEVPHAPELSVMPEEKPQVNLDALLSEMNDLRRRLAECRVRRDEFYIQNNEAGYRREVEQMTELVRQIGEIESNL